MICTFSYYANVPFINPPRLLLCTLLSRVNSIGVHVSSLPVLLIDPQFKLKFGVVSSLGIIDYWHCCRLFLHWRLKVLIWFNYQLLVWSIHSRTNIFAEIQISSLYTTVEYIFVHHFNYFLLYFFIIRCFHLAYWSDH